MPIEVTGMATRWSNHEPDPKRDIEDLLSGMDTARKPMKNDRLAVEVYKTLRHAYVADVEINDNEIVISFEDGETLIMSSECKLEVSLEDGDE